MDTLEKRLHQADKSERDALGETLDQLFYAKASNLVLTAADMMNREGRLSGELRRNLLDIMLLDYLHKQIINSRRVH